MNFDKFRQIDMPDVDAQADPTYIKKLNRLPDERKNPLPVILTVCAAVILVAAVGTWMLIGGAIRNQGEHIADPLGQGETVSESDKDDATEVIELTEKLKQQLLILYDDRFVFLLPEFDEDNPLSVEQVLQFCENSDAAYDEDLTLTSEEFSEYAKKTFGYENMTLTEPKKYEFFKVSHYNRMSPEVSSLEIKDGVATIVYVYTSRKETLRMVCTDEDTLEFGHFVSYDIETDVEIQLEPTTLRKQDALQFWTDNGLYALAEFDKKNPLSTEKILENIEYTEFEKTSDRVITKEEFSEVAKARFGYDVTIDKDIKLGHVVKGSDVSWQYPPLTDYRVKGRSITMTYSGGGMSYTVTHENGVITSFSKKQTHNYKSVKKAFDEIAKKYRFDVFPEMGEDQFTYAESYAQYVAHVIGQTKTYTNANGISVQGITHDQFVTLSTELFKNGSFYGSDEGYFAFEYADKADYGIANLLGDELFVPVRELTPISKVKYKSSKVKDFVGYKLVTVTFTTDNGECDITYTSLDGIMPLVFKSCIRTENLYGKGETLYDAMDDIAREYEMKRMRDFDEGTLPEGMRYHIAALYKKSVRLENGKGGFFQGIPLDDYNELAIKYYGKSDMEGKEPIDFEEQTGYLKYADLVKTDAGIYVCIEIGGETVPCRYVCIDVNYSTTKTGKKCIIAKFNEYHDDKVVPDWEKSLCFTVEGEATLKQFVWFDDGTDGVLFD